MSIVHCDYCDINVDTDYDAEHFIDGTEHCLEKVEAAAPDLLKALENIITKDKEKLNTITKIASKSSTITLYEIDSKYIISAIQAIKKAT